MNEDFVIRLKSIRDRFEIIKDIGEGTYGVVTKCRDNVTNQIVAVKRVRKQKDHKFDYSQTTIREVGLLRELKHPNIVELKMVVQTEDPNEALFLIFEYCEYDLQALLFKKILDTDHIKSIMKQLLIVLQYCAGQKVIHRDLKPANMFITKNNILKLGDFGLARKIKIDRAKYSSTVITLWYRPPEILAHNGYREYKTEVDIWSAGCILYEMVVGEQPFKAKKDLDACQLDAICSVCGCLPKDSYSPEVIKLMEPKKYTNNLKNFLEEKFKDHTEFHGLIPLLLQMLDLNPKERISAEDALNDEFFINIGSKFDPINLPEITSEEIHQRDVSIIKEKKKQQLQQQQQQEQINEMRPEKVQPPPIDV